MSKISNRVRALERADQPGADWEVCWNLSAEDYEVWAGRRGASAYIALLTAAGLLWLSDNERIIAWWIDLGDGERWESPAPVVRRVKYTPPRGWQGTAIKVWDHRTELGQPGTHVRDLERVEGDPWPAHWPLPTLGCEEG